jgi:hypothetical protein
LIYKILMLLLLLVLLNYSYVVFLYDRDLKIKCEQALIIRELNTQAPDVVYISDCSNTNTVESDSIGTSILENLNLFYPDLKMRAVDQAASHAGIFKEWIRQFDTSRSLPKALIVTMNMRSFGAQWINSDLETALQQSVVLLKPYPRIWNRFLISVKGYNYKTEEERLDIVAQAWREKELKFPYKTPYASVREWDSIQANGTYVLPDGSWDFQKISLACHYIKAFAFSLKATNPRVKDFDEIADWAQKAHIKLYFNLIPENIQYADSLVNKDLLFLMRRNADFLIKRYSTENCKVLNNLELLRGNEFTEKDWTTEHYSCKGRMYVAANVALGIKDQFKNSYIKKY